VAIWSQNEKTLLQNNFLYATMKFSSFALAAVAIAASSVNAFSASGPLGRVAQVCDLIEFEGNDDKKNCRN
jgi:hypothetical protein